MLQNGKCYKTVIYSMVPYLLFKNTYIYKNKIDKM